MVTSYGETTLRHFATKVPINHCTVYASYKSGAFSTLRTTMESVYLEMGTDTNLEVITGYYPITDYGMGAATGVIRTTGNNAKSH